MIQDSTPRVFHCIHFWDKLTPTHSGGAEEKPPSLRIVIFFSFPYCCFQSGTVTFERSLRFGPSEQPQSKRAAADYTPPPFLSILRRQAGGHWRSQTRMSWLFQSSSGSAKFYDTDCWAVSILRLLTWLTLFWGKRRSESKNYEFLRSRHFLWGTNLRVKAKAFPSVLGAG